MADFDGPVLSSRRVSAFALSSLLWLGGLAQPPVLPPEPEPTDLHTPTEPPAPEPTPTEPTPTEPPALPSDIETVEFPLDASTRAEPLPRMDAPPTSRPPSERRSIVDLRDPFNRPPLRSRSEGQHALAQQRLLMPDLKDPFAEGTRRVRSRTLDLRVPSDLRDPFRDGLGRQRAGACERTTGDGTVVQAPGTAPSECVGGTDDLHDPFRGPPNPPQP